ncbi:metallophosphoesterase [Rhodococcus artemisiae]|uniref:Metallophosphoesterase n=1 Tax=Rhodococcus artemisiae TaxID=714159 RepID=A0ABU7LJW5_9NOCA|nr:metallophosphoesterase [Rhodococcus artemisiae]MEE2061858.1 metallophosphoesterase [Rhodococcus artemisiae]
MIRLLVAGTFLALITFWLHRRLVRAPGLTGRTALAADIALVALLAVAMAASVTGTVLDPAWARPLGFLGYSWFAAGLYLVLGILVIGVFCLGARLMRRFRTGSSPEPDSSRPPRRALRIATGTLVAATVVTIGYGSLIEAANPRTVHSTIALPGLPNGFDGLRVALITDLHVGPARGARFVQGVVDQVNEQQPDLIILGGDLADGTIEFVGDDLAPLAELDAPLGVYGVSGNHEYYSDDALSWLDHWETLGVRTLRNENVTVTHNGDEIVVAGVHDYTAPAPDAADLPRALTGLSPETFVLLAAHQPRHVLEAQDLGVDLQLSGHTHGGQMWPLGYLVAAANPTVAGLDHFGDTAIYTSQGAGAWGPPVRVATPPEISILELVTQD